MICALLQMKIKYGYLALVLRSPLHLPGPLAARGFVVSNKLVLQVNSNSRPIRPSQGDIVPSLYSSTISPGLQ